MQVSVTSGERLTSADADSHPGQRASEQGEGLRGEGGEPLERKPESAQPALAGLGRSCVTVLSVPKPVCPSVTGLHALMEERTRVVEPGTWPDWPLGPAVGLGGMWGSWSFALCGWAWEPGARGPCPREPPKPRLRQLLEGPASQPGLGSGCAHGVRSCEQRPPELTGGAAPRPHSLPSVGAIGFYGCYVAFFSDCGGGVPSGAPEGWRGGPSPDWPGAQAEAGPRESGAPGWPNL